MAPRSARSFLFVVALPLAFATVIPAQSGRRSAPKPSTPPPATSSTESSPSNPTESAPKKAAAIQLLVGVDDPNSLSHIPQYLADTALEACVRRLSEPAGVSVTAGPRALTRGDA